MAAAQTCPQCGTELACGAPQGLCPKCLLGVGLETPSGSSSATETPSQGITVVAPRPESTARTEQPGDKIGSYKLLQVIGEGGYGTVYMAEQEEPVRRRVALKVVKLGMDTKEVIARFEAARQALAMMDHPNIARVFEAGATDTGRPYFAMELVRGILITQFCDEQKLPVQERLELFTTVCQAVQHAHQKGIIHRDLKPSNVLVTLHDGVAVPKVIDFGIAKATQQRLTDKTLFTQFHQFIGTPAYMSPEQAELSGLDIDTRSDIYSLGVLLYELLVGQPPFDPKELLAAGLDEMRRKIREEEPMKPSTRLTTDLVAADIRRLSSPNQRSEVRDQKSEEVSIRRLRQKRKEWINAIRGELDWIVMKALEKDRRRRYESASAFGQDVERYLRQEPVSAAAPSTVYKFRKFARRNRMTLTAMAAVAVSLLGGAVVSTWLAIRATRAEKKAQTEAAISKAVNDFLQNDLLGQASPESQPDRDLKLRTVLDRASQKIEGRFTNQPLVEAAIRATIVQTYSSLGENRTAEPHAQRAFELYRSQLGTEHRDTLRSINSLSAVYQNQGKLAEAESLHIEALDAHKRALGPEHPDTLNSMNNLAGVYRVQGKLAEAAALQGQVQEIRKRVLGPEHPDTLLSMNNFVALYFFQGKYAEAEVLQAQVLEIQKRVLGPEHPHTLQSMNMLGGAYGSQRKYAAAAKLYAQVVDIQKRVLGPEHPATLLAMNDLSAMYRTQGKQAEAAALAAQVLDTQKRVLGPEHPFTLLSMHNLAGVFHLQGKHTEAATLHARVLEIQKRVLGPEHRHTQWSMTSLASVYGDQGKFGEAESLFREALQLHRSQKAPDTQSQVEVLTGLGHALLAQQKFADAEPPLRECLELRHKTAPDDWPTFNARSLLGGALAGQKRFEAAEPLLLEGYEGLKQREQLVPASSRVHIREAAERLVQLYEAWGKPEKAAEWKQKVRAFDQAEAERKSVLERKEETK